ncbi:S8 family serine peptidase [Spongiactinospora sp. TRM90649]|uniref:S8 family serine peptidase n=1 Tax=Spongiactinospora sp. TRM90649 TaxID=3031114 RepID=UPI0023F98D20|nr:S8 family serine peptidase [Spongiactinospora sp. TRM90649]MDF5752053.1 S8 family serine peptidase [Spongiactinospora sp. TRM90649]
MIGRILAAVTLIALSSAAPTSAAAERAPVRCEPPKGSVRVGESWAQRRVDARRVWPLSRGDGVTVAMVDSGVDLTHPQLRVAGQVDFTGTGHRDCLGHGTAVAMIIAGQYLKGVPCRPMSRAWGSSSTSGSSGFDEVATRS